MDEQTHDLIRHCYKQSCGKTLIRREGESKTRFDTRRHCDVKCSQTNPLLHKAQVDNCTEERAKETRVCLQCDKTFSRTRNESRAVFAVKKCCSRACTNEYLRKERAKPFQIPKICEVCGETFYRRRSTESKKQFEKRRTCSNEHGHALRSSDWTKKSPNGKKRALEHKKKQDEHKLPPSTPLAREIPDAPPRVVTEVWRPESWGGPRKLEASQTV